MFVLAIGNAQAGQMQQTETDFAAIDARLLPIDRVCPGCYLCNRYRLERNSHSDLFAEAEDCSPSSVASACLGDQTFSMPVCYARGGL